MTIFRPCIDLHVGQVKQIVGGTLNSNSNHNPDPNQDGTSTAYTNTNTNTDNAPQPRRSSPSSPSSLKTNHISTLPSTHFASLYRHHGLRGGHVIMLGPGNEEAARAALATWPGGLQVGGGITDENCRDWIDWGAEKVIITSFLFPSGRFSQSRLDSVLDALDHDRNKLVLDLSCRRVVTTGPDNDNSNSSTSGGGSGGGTWYVAMNKWQTLTDMEINQDSIKALEPYTSEFLIHAADHEGLQAGIDVELVTKLSRWCSIPVTYAGGGRDLGDLELVREASDGKVDLTIGSALDIFGGGGVTLEECVEWNGRNQSINN